MEFFSLQHITAFFAEYGYWTVLVALLLESAGVPLPGETVLLVASSLAAHHANLRIEWVALTAIVASMAGDNAGYWIGRSGGRPLLRRYGRFFRISAERIHRGEEFMRLRGPITVAAARFFAGLRIFNGLLAGALQMDYRKFVLFDLIGATLWVSTMCTLGYYFGQKLPWLIHVMGTTGLVLLGVAVASGVVIWLVVRRRPRPPSAIPRM